MPDDMPRGDMLPQVEAGLMPAGAMLAATPATADAGMPQGHMLAGGPPGAMPAGRMDERQPAATDPDASAMPRGMMRPADA